MEIEEKLSARNFFGVCDIAMDIKEKLQTTNNNSVSLPIIRSIIRFNILCPAKSVDLLDDYYRNRQEATGYLLEKGAIKSFKTIKEGFGWDGRIEIQLDRQKFDNYYKILTDIYEKRVVEPEKLAMKAEENKKQNSSNKISIFIDKENGIYRFENDIKLPYPIKSSGNRFALIRALIINNILETDKWRLIYKNDQLISQEINKINKLFQDKLKVDDDLILHVATGGYKLNREGFNIQTESLG